jgi:hypothetical protein
MAILLALPVECLRPLREPPFHPTRRPSPGGDKTDLDDIKLTPIDSGISAEQREPLIKEFRLAKLLCNDGYKV